MSAVAPVNFVAIVLLGVVRCSHHNTAKCAKFCDTKRHKRCCRHLAVQVNWNLLMDKNCRGELSEPEMMNQSVNGESSDFNFLTFCCCSVHHSLTRFPVDGLPPLGNILSRTPRDLDRSELLPSRSSSQSRLASVHEVLLYQKPFGSTAGYSKFPNRPMRRTI